MFTQLFTGKILQVRGNDFGTSPQNRGELHIEANASNAYRGDILMHLILKLSILLLFESTLWRGSLQKNYSRSQSGWSNKLIPELF
jgi:hypothetical protein